MEDSDNKQFQRYVHLMKTEAFVETKHSLFTEDYSDCVKDRAITHWNHSREGFVLNLKRYT
jgi:hypothetical protein